MLLARAAGKIPFYAGLRLFKYSLVSVKIEDKPRAKTGALLTAHRGGDEQLGLTTHLCHQP
jgi:hypothetical protein